MLCDSPPLLLPSYFSPVFPIILFQHSFCTSPNRTYSLHLCPASTSCHLSSIDALSSHPLWELLPLSTGCDSCVSLYHRMSVFWPQSVLLRTILNSFHPLLTFPLSYQPCGERREWTVHGGEGGGSGEEVRRREAAALKAWCHKSSSAGRCLEQWVCTSVPWSSGRNWGKHFGKATKFPQARLYAPQLLKSHVCIWGHRVCPMYESCLWWNLAGYKFVMAVLSLPSRTARISIEWPQTSSEFWNQCALH